MTNDLDDTASASDDTDGGESIAIPDGLGENGRAFALWVKEHHVSRVLIRSLDDPCSADLPYGIIDPSDLSMAEYDALSRSINAAQQNILIRITDDCGHFFAVVDNNVFKGENNFVYPHFGYQRVFVDNPLRGHWVCSVDARSRLARESTPAAIATVLVNHLLIGMTARERSLMPVISWADPVKTTLDDVFLPLSRSLPLQSSADSPGGGLITRINRLRHPHKAGRKAPAAPAPARIDTAPDDAAIARVRRLASTTCGLPPALADRMNALADNADEAMALLRESPTSEHAATIRAIVDNDVNAATAIAFAWSSSALASKSRAMTDAVAETMLDIRRMVSASTVARQPARLDIDRIR
jgi:hypothetical protein